MILKNLYKYLLKCNTVYIMIVFDERNIDVVFNKVRQCIKVCSITLWKDDGFDVGALGL